MATRKPLSTLEDAFIMIHDSTVYDITPLSPARFVLLQFYPPPSRPLRQLSPSVSYEAQSSGFGSLAGRPGKPDGCRSLPGIEQASERRSIFPCLKCWFFWLQPCCAVLVRQRRERVIVSQRFLLRICLWRSFDPGFPYSCTFVLGVR